MAQFTEAALAAIVQQAQVALLPDKRFGIWKDVALTYDTTGLVLTGKTNVVNLPEKLVELLGPSHPLKVNLEVLPQADLSADQRYAIVRQAWVNVRREPAHRAELVTQYSLGDVLTVLELLGPDQEWVLVQGHADGYCGYIQYKGLYLCNAASKDQWSTGDKVTIAFTRLGYVESSDADNPEAVQVNPGVLLPYPVETDEEVRFPYFIPNTTLRLSTDELIEMVALQEIGHGDQAEDLDHYDIYYTRLMGLPYLWGGNTFNGVDCSGFIQLVARQAGYWAPRDADQQYRTTAIDLPHNLTDLPQYCLLFFADPGKKVSHVALYLGGGLMVHADSSLRIESLDPDSPVYAPKRAATWVGVGLMSNFVSMSMQDQRKVITFATSPFANPAYL